MFVPYLPIYLFLCQNDSYYIAGQGDDENALVDNEEAQAEEVNFNYKSLSGF